MKNSMDAVHKRREEIFKYLQNHRSARISALAEHFRISAVTVRRDVEALEKKGYVTKGFGVVTCILPPSGDVNYVQPTGNPTPSKLAIAKTAASFIQDGDLVFFNSSSTALFILDYLKNVHATIITNNGRALYSKRASGIELILTGGEVYGQKQSLVGEIALNAISKVMASKCFIGVSGIDAHAGITSAVMQETAINQSMLQHCAGPKIVVADGSKLGVSRSFFSGDIKDITHIITDSSADEETLDSFRKKGIEVIIATSD